MVAKSTFSSAIKEGSVEIDELGSNLGVPPLVRVSSKNIVMVEKTLPGAIIQIGPSRLNATRELIAARYRLNNDSGKIEVI